MKLFAYELRKLTNSRFVLASILALFLLNIALCLYSVNDPYPFPDDTALKVYELYYEDPVEIDGIYNSWKLEYTEYENRYKSYLKRGGIEPIPPENTWFSDEIGDSRFYNKLYYDVERQTAYREDISAVVKTAMQSKLNLEKANGTDSYEYRYQNEIIRRYTELYENVTIGFEYSRGYDSLLNCRIPMILTLLGAALISGYFYTVERSNSSLAMLRSMVNGRGKLISAKIIATFFVVLFVFVILQLTAFLIVGASIGYSSPFNRIQVFESFTYCQYDLTIFAVCILDLVLKVICLFFFVALFLLVASKTDYLTSCTVNIALCVAVVLLYYYTDRYQLLNSLHLVNPLVLPFESLMRYRAYNVFGGTFELVPTLSAVMIVLSLIAVGGSYMLYLSSTTGVFSLFGRMKITKLHLPALNLGGDKSISPMRHEVYKILGSRTVTIVLAVFFVLTALTIPIDIGKQSTNEAKLQDYIEASLYGEYSPEKLSYVKAEGKRIGDAIQKYDECVDEYFQGEMSLEEFKPIADERVYADSRKGAYAKLNSYAEYLSAQGDSAWFVYETGWKLLFSDYNMLPIIIVIAFVGSRLIGVEYESSTSSGGFHQLLRTTQKGRATTYRNKTSILFMLIAVLHSVQYLYRLILISREYTLIGATAPFQSISAFGGSVFGECRIGLYLLLHYVFTLATLIMLGCIVMGLTYLSRKGVVAFVGVVAVAVIPQLLGYLGLTLPKFLSIVKLVNLTNMRSISMLCGLAVMIAVSIWAIISSYTAYERTNPKR